MFYCIAQAKKPEHRKKQPLRHRHQSKKTVGKVTFENEKTLMGLTTKLFCAEKYSSWPAQHRLKLLDLSDFPLATVQGRGFTLTPSSAKKEK